jgi:hypothetical protein
MSAHSPLPPRRSSKEAAADLVGMFVPEAEGAEKDLRARLHLARDTAQVRRERAKAYESGRLYAVAADVARAWVFRRGVTVEQLEEAIKVLTWLFLAAGAIDRIENSDG